MKEEHLWIAGGIAALVIGFIVIKKSSAAAAASSGAHAQNASTFGKAAGESGQASTGPASIDLLALSDPSHVFTTQEVQYLLSKWGASPSPAITGNWDDTTTLAVRDFQTRGTNFGPMNITGDPFDVGTSRALQAYAATLLGSGAQAQLGISVTDLQTLFQPYVPITGVMDAATQARLNLYAPLLNPPSASGTQLSLSEPRVQTYFLAVAKQARLAGY